MQLYYLLNLVQRKLMLKRTYLIAIFLLHIFHNSLEQNQNYHTNIQFLITNYMNPYLMQQPGSNKKLMGSIFRSSTVNRELKINEITQECKRLRIAIQKTQFTQLEEGLGIKSYKVYRYQNVRPQTIFLFICQGGQIRKAYTFYLGSQLQSATVKTERDVVTLLENSLKILELSSENYLSKHYQNVKNQEKISHLINSLAQQCKKIEKSSNNLEAIQRIKATPEYANLIQYLKDICLNLQQLCKQNRKQAYNIEKDNLEYQQSLFALENIKEQLETAVVQYQSTRQQYMDIPNIINTIVQDKKRKFQSKDFYDQASLQRYIDELTQLKILQNEKKYIV